MPSSYFKKTLLITEISNNFFVRKLHLYLIDFSIKLFINSLIINKKEIKWNYKNLTFTLTPIDAVMP